MSDVISRRKYFTKDKHVDLTEPIMLAPGPHPNVHSNVSLPATDKRKPAAAKSPPDAPRHKLWLMFHATRVNIGSNCSFQKNEVAKSGYTISAAIRDARFSHGNDAHKPLCLSRATALRISGTAVERRSIRLPMTKNHLRAAFRTSELAAFTGNRQEHRIVVRVKP